MFFETISVIRRNFLLFAIGVLAAWFTVRFTTNGGTKAFVLIYMAYIFQSAVLSGGKFKTTTWKSGFFWRSFVLVGVVTAIIFAAAPMVSPDRAVGTIELFGFVAIFGNAVLALFGIWPTSYLDGPGIGLGQAFRRSLRGFLPTYFRLFAAMVAPALLEMILAILGPADLYADGALSIPIVALSLLSVTVDAFSNTYVSVVLARKYLSSKGEPFISGEIGQAPA